jgi:hypothetical protein
MSEDKPNALAQSIEDHVRLKALLEDAQRQSLRIGSFLGRGSYGAVLDVTSPEEGPCALKIPWVGEVAVDDHPDLAPYGHGPNRIEQIGLTGPFCLFAPSSLQEAAALLLAGVQRQMERGAERPLPRIHRLVELGGLPAVLMERVWGPSLRELMRRDREQAVSKLEPIKRSIAQLHAVFGAHGDLKPEHVLFESSTQEVVLLDPLGDATATWIGSVGYALPHVGGLLRDLGALAAMVAEAFGGTLGWNGRVAYCLANRGNGRFSWGIRNERVHEAMREGTRNVPQPWRDWALEVGAACVDGVFGGDDHGLDPNWIETMLR